MYFRPPKLIRRFFPQLIWTIQSADSLFLTFDDGPNPHVTPWVLDMLDKYNAKATFFCIGKNAEQYPEIIERIIGGGHAIGNHTYSHTKSLLNTCEHYVEDVDLANRFLHSNIFRPPYGRITRSQARRIAERYHIIMWDTLSRDYSKLISHHKCVREVVPYLRAGGIVAFHDSLKASRNMRYALPRVLEAAAELNLICRAIEL